MGGEIDDPVIEPALLLSLPKKPTDFDDGMLTACEVADWVVLSACNTGRRQAQRRSFVRSHARVF
jgi:CHAT domain-containing protein